MSVMIDNTEELLTVLKKLDLKVHSVDELHQLLTTINASYDPEAARQKTGRLIGVAVPGMMAGAAAITSCVLVAQGHEVSGIGVGGLALTWGACALVSMAAVIASTIMLSVRPSPDLRDNPPRSQSERMPGATGIVRELEV